MTDDIATSMVNAAGSTSSNGELNNNNNNDVIFTLSLQSRQEGRKVISIKASSTTQELYERVTMEFGGASIQSIKGGGGFPPKLISAERTTQLLNVLSNQERLQVELAPSASAAAAAVNNNKKRKTAPKKKNEPQESNGVDATSVTVHPNMNNGGRKSKRAAAKAAIESMPAMIKAQDEYLKAEQQQQQSSSSSSSKKRSRPVNTATNNSSTTVSSRRQPKSGGKISASAGTGRRLADGAAVSNPTAAGRRAAAAAQRSRLGSSKNNNNNTSTDLSEALMGALNDRGQMGIILRRGMKNAVQASYETTKSFSRLAAIQAKSYQMTTITMNPNNDPTVTPDITTTGAGSSTTTSSSSSHLKVVYHGSVDKARVEEIVDCIPLDVLRAVMEGIYASDPEALRPENLARLSPRVLWSCVYHCPTTETTTIPNMYRHLLPHLDWSFLRRRAAQLSEKALENKRQEEEKERQRSNGGDAVVVNMEQAAEAVAAVEHAMEHLHEYQTEARKARAAQAAMARLQRQQNQGNGAALTSWTLVTPSEPDRDELRECIESSLPAGTTPTIISKWITQLMKDSHIHNWRELANVAGATEMSEIATKLGNVESKHVEAWIDFAQSKSVEEIIVEICDGNVRAVELLTERARSGTPKDLAGWRAIPDVLLQQLYDNGEAKTEDEEWINLETLAEWCHRSHALLQRVEWLNWYASNLQ
jgi:nucleotide-binding universal stress UspA family protein